MTHTPTSNTMYAVRIFFAAAMSVAMALVYMNVVRAETTVSAGTLLTCGDAPAVYYVSTQGERHVFPTRDTFSSWYPQADAFSSVQSMSVAACADIAFGGNITVRPGVFLLKLPYDSSVYALDASRTLRHVTSASILRNWYPSSNAALPDAGWEAHLRVAPEEFWNDYSIGAPIVSEADFDMSAAQAAFPTVEMLLTGTVLPTPPEPQPEPTPAPTPTPAPSPSPSPSPAPAGVANIGTNIGEASYWSGNWPYKDAFKQTDPFFSGTYDTWSDGRVLQKDAQGWVTSLLPGQIAKTIVIGSQETYPNAIPQGDYTILYDGSGTLDYIGATVISRSAGREVVRVGQSGLILYITATTPSNYLRNIRVLLPGGTCDGDAFSFSPGQETCAGTFRSFEQTYQEQPFHPVFLRELRPYKTLRFMDLMMTNRERDVRDVDEAAVIVSWSDYPSPDDAHWKPVPIQTLVNLANTLDADPYFTVPHTANDGFVRSMAEVIRDGLEPGLKAYIEYSNEVWNDIFDQHQYANREGCLRYSGDPNGECDPDGVVGPLPLCAYTPWNAAQERCAAYGSRYFAVRTAEIMAIVDEVFGVTRPDRVVRVLGGQIGGAEWRAGSQFTQVVAQGGVVADYIDAFAVAPYFGGSMTFSSVDEAFTTIPAARNGAPAGTYRIIAGDPSEYGGVVDWIQKDRDYLASQPALANIQLMAYEGGQHLLSDHSDAQTNLVMAINRDPRMKDVYTQYLGLWNSITGNAPFVHFNSANVWGKFGSWGDKEYQGQSRNNAPKYDALVSEIEKQTGTSYPDVSGMSGTVTVQGDSAPAPTPDPIPVPTPDPKSKSEPKSTPTPTPTTGDIEVIADGAYVTWIIGGSLGQQGGTMMVFGQSPNPEHKVGQTTAYLRSYDGSSANAWVNDVYGPGTYYVRICSYNASNDTCTNYSDEVTVTL